MAVDFPQHHDINTVSALAQSEFFIRFFSGESSFLVGVSIFEDSFICFFLVLFSVYALYNGMGRVSEDMVAHTVQTQ